MTSVVVNTHAAKVVLLAGGYDDANSLLLALLDGNPDSYLPQCYLGILNGLVLGAYAPATESLQRAADLSGQNSSVLAILGSVYAKAGRASDAEDILSILLSKRRESYVTATGLAPLYFELGRTDEAFKGLEFAVEERCILLSWLASCQPRSQRLTTIGHPVRPVSVCPLWARTVSELVPLIRGRTGNAHLFLNRYGHRMTRFGIYMFIERHLRTAAQEVPSLKNKRMGPHSIHHTTATHLLRAGATLIQSKHG